MSVPFRRAYRMGMPNTLRRWTRDEVHALPDDGNRYELLEGELLVSPAPRGSHQRAVLALYRLVEPYVREHRLGYTCLAPADLDFGTGEALQPDLFVVRLKDGREPVEWSEFGIPFLIAEVLSPSTARYDRTLKRGFFQRRDVADYWIVDTDARLVEHWRPGDERPGILDVRLDWQPNPGIPPLVVDLPAYFRVVWSESLPPAE